jgi:CheY-like chemotaxis protein
MMSELKSPPTLLLIEDDLDDQRLLRRALSKIGRPIVVDVALDGREALDYLSRAWADGAPRLKARPFLVLSDVNLPVGSGWDVVGWIRNRPELSAVPVLIWTSLPTPEGAERARTMGAIQYLSKPLTLEGYARIAGTIAKFLGD